MPVLASSILRARSALLRARRELLVGQVLRVPNCAAAGRCDRGADQRDRLDITPKHDRCTRALIALALLQWPLGREPAPAETTQHDLRSADVLDPVMISVVGIIAGLVVLGGLMAERSA